MKTEIKKSLVGWEVEFTIDHQSFTLSEVDSKESVQIMKKSLEVALNRLTISHVSDLLIAWEAFKKANWWESEAIDVEKVLIKEFSERYSR